MTNKDIIESLKKMVESPYLIYGWMPKSEIEDLLKNVENDKVEENKVENNDKNEVYLVCGEYRENKVGSSSSKCIGGNVLKSFDSFDKARECLRSLMNAKLEEEEIIKSHWYNVDAFSVFFKKGTNKEEEDYYYIRKMEVE